ncbi:MAG: phosphonate ABC transporter ATP-binding protein [Alphaproteobacteria bacterium]
MAAVEVSDFSKTFSRGRRALDGISLTVQPGEMVALIGASGSGKSTLIRHIAGLSVGDRDCGAIHVLGGAMQQGGRLAPGVRQKRARIGVIFQQFNLVGRFTLLSNVLVGLLGQIDATRGCCGLFTDAEKRQAMAALARVGMEDYALQRASTLSGGQQQRGAIARALLQRAEVLLADEPIASLDPASALRVMDTLADINRKDGMTVVVSLHQVDYALRCCPRTVALRDGRVVYDGPSSALTRGFLTEIYGAESEELLLAGMPARRPQPVRQPLSALAYA